MSGPLFQRLLRYNLHGNSGSFLPAQTQAVISETDLHGVAEGSEAEHLNLFPFEEAHFHQALHHGILPSNSLYVSALTKLQLVEGGHANFFY